jgi:hypothetical protein
MSRVVTAEFVSSREIESLDDREQLVIGRVARRSEKTYQEISGLFG